MFRSIVQKTRSSSRLSSNGNFASIVRRFWYARQQSCDDEFTACNGRSRHNVNTFSPRGMAGRSNIVNRHYSTPTMAQVDETTSGYLRNGESFPLKLAELMVLHRATKALSSACNIGLFDYLDAENGARTADEISEHCKSSVNGITRLLHACVALDLLKKIGEEEEIFELTEDSQRYLTKNSPDTLRGEIACIDMEYMLTGNLEHAVRDGTTQWPRTLGIPEGGNLFDFVYANEMFTLQFLAGMHGVSNVASPILVKNINLGEFKNVCDLGGKRRFIGYVFLHFKPSSS